MLSAEGVIFVVLEYGDIDLARLLARNDAARKEGRNAEAGADENFIRLYWEQMLLVRGAAWASVSGYVLDVKDLITCIAMQH